VYSFGSIVLVPKQPKRMAVGIVAFIAAHTTGHDKSDAAITAHDD
jgi:hypothetical protein